MAANPDIIEYKAKRICLNASGDVSVGGQLRQNFKRQTLDVRQNYYRDCKSQQVPGNEFTPVIPRNPAGGAMVIPVETETNGGILVESKEWQNRQRVYEFCLLGNLDNKAANADGEVKIRVQLTFQNSDAKINGGANVVENFDWNIGTQTILVDNQFAVNLRLVILGAWNDDADLYAQLSGTAIKSSGASASHFVSTLRKIVSCAKLNANLNLLVNSTTTAPVLPGEVAVNHLTVRVQ